MERKRRKITISVSMSPFLVEKIDKETENEKYSSPSDLISIAVAEHLVKEDTGLIDESIDRFLTIFLSDEICLKTLTDTLHTDLKFRISALKKKAKACIELGEFKEAIKCLNQAKDLEANPTEIKDIPQKENVSIVYGIIDNEDSEL